MKDFIFIMTSGIFLHVFDIHLSGRSSESIHWEKYHLKNSFVEQVETEICCIAQHSLLDCVGTR